MAHRGTWRPKRSALATTLTLATTLISAVVLTAACSGDGGGNDPALDGDPGDPVAGEQVYADYCGACHGRDFEGSVQGPSHLDAVFDPVSTTDADYRNAIRNGAEETNYDFGDMPPIRSLDDRQIADVIAYIRSVQAERGFNEG